MSGKPSGPGMEEPNLIDIPGFKYRVTKQGFRVVELDPWADPDKDQEWLDAVRSVMDENSFKREFLRDWTTGKGEAFYPEFYRVRDQVVRPAPGLLDSPILRGWDFGQRRPACVWAQWDPINKRIWFLREVMPDNVSTWVHRDLVLYLSGQRSYYEIRPGARSWVDRITEDDRYPNPPWFPPGRPSQPRTFIDFSGPEALTIQANVEDESEHRTAAQILAAEGIYLRVWSGRVKDRTDIFRRLMEPRIDGTFSGYYDPAVPILIAGLSGGVSYKRGTKNEPMPEEPQKDGTHEHIHDAAGYIIVNVIGLQERDYPQAMPAIPPDNDPYRFRQSAVPDDVDYATRLR